MRRRVSWCRSELPRRSNRFPQVESVLTRALTKRHFASALCRLPLLAMPVAPSIAAPADRGLNAQQRQTTERILRREIEAGSVPGIGYSIGNANETLAEGTFGLRTVVPALPMLAGTRCALASLRKQFVAACVFLLHERGALSLDVPLASYLPEYRHAHEMTLRQGTHDAQRHSCRYAVVRSADRQPYERFNTPRQAREASRAYHAS
jgi:CubicO group peptidase (beta-lactamase class C family)